MSNWIIVLLGRLLAAAPTQLQSHTKRGWCNEGGTDRGLIPTRILQAVQNKVKEKTMRIELKLKQ